MCDHRVPGYISQPVFLFVCFFTTFIEVREGIKSTMQLCIHFASQLYLTALLPEGTLG